jgi:hypothetical protein
VPPGDYVLCVVTDLESDQLQDPESLEQPAQGSIQSVSARERLAVPRSRGVRAASRRLSPTLRGEVRRPAARNEKVPRYVRRATSGGGSRNREATGAARARTGFDAGRRISVDEPDLPAGLLPPGLLALS